MLDWSLPALIWAAAIFIVVITGGGGDGSIGGRLIGQLIAAMALVAVLRRPAPLSWQRRASDYFAIGIVALLLLQLIPLPPSLWTAMPGREIFEQGDLLVFDALPWRPISLQPAQTLYTVIYLLPALTFYFAYRLGSEERRRAILLGLAAAWLFAVLFGLLQFAASGIAPRFYANAHSTIAVGFFANRNHQACFIAMGIPLLAMIVQRLRTGRTPDELRIVYGAALAVALFAIIAVLGTGSRAGLVLILASTGLTSAILFALAGERHTPMFWPAVSGGGGIMVAVAAIALFSGSRAGSAVSRLAAEDDPREEIWPVVIDALQAFWPIGSGGGSFRRALEVHEPLSAIGIKYINHAHNDVLELVMEFGVLGVALIAAVIGWLAMMVLRARKAKSAQAIGLGMALVAIALPLLHSLVDYPFRTAAIFTATFVAIAVATSAAEIAGGRRRTNT